MPKSKVTRKLPPKNPGSKKSSKPEKSRLKKSPSIISLKKPLPKKGRKPEKQSKKLLRGSEEKSSKTEAQIVYLSLDGKPLKKPTGKVGTYGIRQGKKGKIVKLEMEPQRLSKNDLQELSSQVKMKAERGIKIKKMRLTFFQISSKEQQKDKKGKLKFDVPTKGPQRGKQVPIYKTVTRFKRPPANVAWRQVIYDGGKYNRAVHPYIQKRSAYEEVKATALDEIGFNTFKEVKDYLVGTLQTDTMLLKGKTITHALRQFQPPVAPEWLRKKGVNTIHVKAFVNFKRGGVDENFVAEAEVPYLSYVANTLGAQIRKKLANMGSMFYSAKELAKIYGRVLKKYEKAKGGLGSTKARLELGAISRFARQAPYNKDYAFSLKKILDKKMDAKDFHLKKADDVTIRLEYRFYKQPGKMKTKKGKK